MEEVWFWVGDWEVEGEGFGGREELGEAPEDGHSVDEFVDVGDVGCCGETGSGKEWLIGWFSDDVAFGVRAGDGASVVLRVPFLSGREKGRGVSLTVVL